MLTTRATFGRVAQMTDDRFNSPTPDELRIVRQGVDYTKKKLAKAKAKEVEANPRCVVCMEIIKIKQKSGKTCVVCQAKLDSGQTALVCLDGRFAFVEPKKLLESKLLLNQNVDVHSPEKSTSIPAEIMKKLIGRVQPVMPELMDWFEAQLADKNKAN